MKIKSENLVIRSAIEGDAEHLAAWWNNGEVMAHAGFPHGLGISIEETRRLIARNEIERGQRCILEVDGLRIGEMSYQIENSTAEIGIKVCEAHWQNQGLGTRFLRTLIAYLFGEENRNQDQPIEKIILDTNLNNSRAQHVYEKLGFNKVRVNEKAWQDQLGEWQSSVDYELSRTAFRFTNL